MANIDYVTRAPDGKEVEELAKKEIHQALRSKVVPQQIKTGKTCEKQFQAQKDGPEKALLLKGFERLKRFEGFEGLSGQALQKKPRYPLSKERLSRTCLRN